MQPPQNEPRSPDVVTIAVALVVLLAIWAGVRSLLVYVTPPSAEPLPIVATFPAQQQSALQPAPSLTPLPLPTATPTATRTPSPNHTPEPTPLPLTPTPTPLLPTPRPEGESAERLPILMYHYLSIPPDNADIYRQDLSVTPENFRQQLTYLRDNGFTTIDLYDLALALANQIQLPPKPIILTFDDGYVDNYHNAFPILQQFGMKAVFFIITNPIEQGDGQYMTWEMVREMQLAGMSIELHSQTHPDLTLLTHSDKVWEIKAAQQLIYERVGHYPLFLAYPGGRYDEAVLGVVREADLWGAVTTTWGAQHHYERRYELKRMRMRLTTTMPIFASIVNLEESP